VHETPDEVALLQDLLDRTYEGAGAHLRSIFTTERRLSAVELVRVLRGVCVLDLATVTASGEPIVAPVDGLFFRGRFWFGSAPSSVRFRHIRARPSVSAAHTRGEELCVIVHGAAREIDKAEAQSEAFRDYNREVYGPQWDSWGYWPSMPYAVIEPRRMYAADMRRGVVAQASPDLPNQ
jgi:nitroimidazol reductase NimA-like FMN-containing flavoprotein (pyridoxamine 5'-phosphate oxidase superfamily)